MKPVAIRIDATSMVRNLVLACVGLELMFFSLDYRINYSGGATSSAVRRLFNTAREDSLPAWFSIMQTALVALTLWLVYAVVRQGASRWRRMGWFALAAFVTYLAFDDGAHIHERLGTAYEDMFSAQAAAGSLGAWTLDVFPSYRWQIVFLPAFALMGLFMFVFLARELRGRLPRVAMTVALVCLAAAVSLDFFEGLDRSHPLNPYTAITETWHLDYWSARNFGTQPYNALLHFSKSIEECMEMFAMTLLWAVFLGHLAKVGRRVEIAFDEHVALYEVPAASRRVRPLPLVVQPGVREQPRAA